MAEIKTPIEYSPSWTFFEGKWHDGNVPIMGPRTHAAWLGSVVFDGARAFEGVVPDLDRHVARANQSAINFGLKPVVDAGTWLALANEGIARFAANAELYVRPMYWAQNGSGGGVLFDPETTNWCLCIYEAPMPKSVGNAITLSPFRRPTAECAPVEAKAACLYPNNSRALAEAAGRGFQNALMLDMLGNVAEFGNSNVFMARDGVVYTPVPNGTFLNGITRQRVISLLRGDGITVIEKTLRYADFLAADEIFSTGNFAKVAPVIRIDDRELKPGPLYSRARKLLGLCACREAGGVGAVNGELAGQSALGRPRTARRQQTGADRGPTRPSSTCARGAPACPSSAGANRQCWCPLPARRWHRARAPAWPSPDGPGWGQTV